MMQYIQHLVLSYTVGQSMIPDSLQGYEQLYVLRLGIMVDAVKMRGGRGMFVSVSRAAHCAAQWTGS
jgi:hypothetical protein